MSERIDVAGVRLSSPDKVLFPGQGVTKAELAAHYERVCKRMLPLMKNRLVSLVRCPDGRDGECFYQKHASRGFPDALRTMEITESTGKKGEYLYVANLAGVIAGVQMGTLEFHIWGSRIDRLERPDRLVFDLDPAPEVGFCEVKAAARDVRDLLGELGLESVALLTGGKGIHVIAPLERRQDWDETKTFAANFARAMAANDPDRFVATASKAKRKGRIFIDYLRNERGSTAIAPYSTRAREKCPVATPVGWDELGEIESANAFGLSDMKGLLSRKDPWAAASQWRQSITTAMQEAIAGRAD